MKVSRGELTVLVITALILVIMGLCHVNGTRAQALEPLSEAEVRTPEESGKPPEKLVNINTAGEEELTALPGIGPTRARAIIEYRTEHGPFSYVEDLICIPGIGEKTIEELLKYATAGGTEYAENSGG